MTATHLLGGTLPCYGQTDNAVGYDTTDGSCRSHDQYPLTLVLGDDTPTAQPACDALYPGYENLFRVANLLENGYRTPPAIVWLCTCQT